MMSNTLSTIELKELFIKNKLWEQVKENTLECLWEKGSVKNYPKEKILIHAREPIQYVFIQISGKSIVYNLSHAGKRKILLIFGSGMLLNEYVIGCHSSSVYCETIEESNVLRIPVNDFIKCMQEDFMLTKTVLGMQERKIWRLGHQLKNTMGSIYMERKLAAKLWKLCRDFGIPKENGIEIDIDMTLTFLADMLGTPRETASRACKTLSGMEMIRIKNRRITVTDPEHLSEFYRTGKRNPK